MPILPPPNNTNANVSGSGAANATILYRQLDENGEPRWGASKADFISDIDAVAQAVLTRLRLFEGEWWEDKMQGLPLWQSILGVGGAGKNQSAVNLLIQQVILGTPYVTGINSVQSSYDATSRSYKFYCKITTQFGVIAVTNMPTPPDQAYPGVQ